MCTASHLADLAANNSVHNGGARGSTRAQSFVNRLPQSREFGAGWDPIGGAYLTRAAMTAPANHPRVLQIAVLPGNSQKRRLMRFSIIQQKRGNETSGRTGWAEPL